MGLIEDVSGLKVALDTSLLIYFLEANPDYAQMVEPIFAAADRYELRLVTSIVTLLEVLVLPYRQNRLDLVMAYQNILENNSSITLVAVNPSLAKIAAQLRAKYALRTPDALQIAAAIATEANVFLTNDLRLKSVTEIPVKVLKDYLGKDA